MTTRDKIGTVILVGLFIVLGLVLIWSMPSRPSKTFSPANSPIVQQRIKNLEKSK